MKKLKTALAALVVAVMLSVTFVPVFAEGYTTIYLASNQYWSKGYGATHDTNYLLCGAKCHSVAPYSGVDLFRRIQCKVANTYGETIGDEDVYTLTEGATDFTEIKIKNGKLNTSAIFFHFRGNSPEQAVAVVSYTGTIMKDPD